MRIAYYPSDMDAPGSYRCLFPGRQLREKGGIDVVLPPKELKTGPDGKRRWNFDVGFDPPSPMAHIWVLQSRFERLWGEEGVAHLRNWGIATVADVDDNYEELPYWNPAFYGTHPYRRDDGVIVSREQRRSMARQLKWKKMPPNKHNRLHLREVFKQVDAMTVSTPYLKDLYAPYNGNIHVVRNYVDWDMWRDITPQYEVKRWQNRIRIGYTGVFTYRRGDLEVLRPWIGRWMVKHPNVDFVANSKEVHDFLAIPPRQRVIVKEYDFLNPDTGEYAMPRKTATMDIGLVPLAPGGMSEAKSHLKGMEYNAAGIPYIATPTESYRWYTREMKNGMLAHNENYWTSYLNDLVIHDDMRRAMGEEARDHAYAHSIQQNWREWLAVYDSVYGDKYTQLARGAIARGAVQKVSELSGMLTLADEIQLNTVLEVGSARGGTFWALAQLAADDAMMISIDIPSGSPLDVRGGKDVYGNRSRDRFKEFIREGQKLRLLDMNSQALSTVATLRSALGDRQVDLLFIDADHRYEGVKRDYELYSPFVREGGLIVFHDMIPQNDPRSGVHLLWNEIKDCDKSQSCIELIGRDNWGMGQWGGIGVIKKREGSLVA